MSHEYLLIVYSDRSYISVPKTIGYNMQYVKVCNALSACMSPMQVNKDESCDFRVCTSKGLL